MHLEGMGLDEPSTSALLSYIQSQQGAGGFNDNNRLIAATVLKNKIKQIYGVSNRQSVN
jgi:hypothetical protein